MRSWRRFAARRGAGSRPGAVCTPGERTSGGRTKLRGVSEVPDWGLGIPDLVLRASYLRGVPLHRGLGEETGAARRDGEGRLDSDRLLALVLRSTCKFFSYLLYDLLVKEAS